MFTYTAIRFILKIMHIKKMMIWSETLVEYDVRLGLCTINYCKRISHPRHDVNGQACLYEMKTSVNKQAW